MAAAANPAKLRTLEKEAQREGKILKRKLQRHREAERDQAEHGWGDKPVKREERPYGMSHDRVEPKLESESRGGEGSTHSKLSCARSRQEQLSRARFVNGFSSPSNCC